MGLALTSICCTSPEHPWDLVVSLCLPLSCDDGSWILMYKFQFLNLGISTHIRQIVVRVSSAHSSDFPHVFGDEDHRILWCKGFDYLVIGRNWDFEFLLGFQLLG